MVEPSLEDLFPGLRGQPYQMASPGDRRSNCNAFAAGDQRSWWWPDLAEEDSCLRWGGKRSPRRGSKSHGRPVEWG
jgi:hypothetical protein